MLELGLHVGRERREMVGGAKVSWAGLCAAEELLVLPQLPVGCVMSQYPPTPCMLHGVIQQEGCHQNFTNGSASPWDLRIMS